MVNSQEPSDPIFYSLMYAKHLSQIGVQNHNDPNWSRGFQSYPKKQASKKCGLYLLLWVDIFFDSELLW